MSVAEAAVKRRSRRLPIPGVSVDVTLEGEADNRWTCSAIDINGDGMALTLPPDVAIGTRLRLSFRPDETTEFDAVPCVVIRQDLVGGHGAVMFYGWGEESVIELWAFLGARI